MDNRKERLSKNGKPIGRPRKYGTAPITISLRFPEDFHAQLVSVCQNSGRGLGEEIMHRVMQSFDREALLAQVREAVKPRGLTKYALEAMAESYSDQEAQANNRVQNYPLKNGYLPT